MIIHKTRYATGCSTVYAPSFFPSSYIKEKCGLTAAFSRSRSCTITLDFFSYAYASEMYSPRPPPARERGPDSLSLRAFRVPTPSRALAYGSLSFAEEIARDRPAIKRRP